MGEAAAGLRADGNDPVERENIYGEEGAITGGGKLGE